jgi:hypothetical protein
LTPVILGVPEIRTRRAEKLIAAADENCNGHWFETLRPSDFLIVLLFETNHVRYHD